MKLPVYLSALVLFSILFCYRAPGKSTNEPGEGFESEYDNAYKSLAIPDAQRAVSLAHTSYQKGKAYHLLGYIYRNKGDYIQATKQFLKAESAYHRADAKALQADICEKLGVIFYKTLNYRNSLLFYNKTLHLRKELNSPKKADTMFNIGLSYHKLGRYDSAVTYLFAAADEYEAQGKDEDVSDALHQVGFIQHDIEDYDKAISYYLKSLDIATQLQDTTNLARINNDIGMTYLATGNLPAAEVYLGRSLAIKTAMQDSALLISTYSNLGELALQRGDTATAHQYYGLAASHWQPGNISEHAVDAIAWLIEQQVGNIANLSIDLATITRDVYANNRELTKMKLFFEGQLATRLHENQKRKAALQAEKIKWAIGIGLVLLILMAFGIRYYRRSRRNERKLTMIRRIAMR